MALTDDDITATNSLTVVNKLTILEADLVSTFAEFLSGAASKGYIKGEVGIGTANPSNMLDVAGAASVGYSATAAPAGGLIVSGDVGIGTHLPDAKLHVLGDAHITGKLTVGGVFQGTVQSSNLTSGAVQTVHLQNEAVTLDKIAAGARGIASVEGVSSPGGSIDLVPANSVTISGNNLTKQITIGETHSTRSDNPHSTTAAQVGALPLTGGVLAGNLKVKGSLNASSNAGVLDLEGEDHAYIQWYPLKFTSGRKGWIGYGSANTTTMHVQNEAGPLVLGGTSVEASGPLRARASLHASGNGGVLSIEGADHACIQWYPMTVAAGRKGWIGYGSANTTAMHVQNDAGLLVLGGTSVEASGPLHARASLHASGNGGVLNIEGADSAYIQWYPMTVAAGRKGWIGYGSLNTTTMHVQNDAGELVLGGTSVVANGPLRVNASLDVRGDIAIHGKLAFQGYDAWLRLNLAGAFTSGVHTPGNFAPGALNVGGVNSWGNPGSGNAWIAGQLTVYGRANLNAGVIANGVAVGTDPDGSVNFPYPYETIGVTDPRFNLRLHSPNGVYIHTSNSVVSIDEAGRIGTLGQSPTPRTTGWDGGIHTHDVEAEGTIWSRHGYQSGERDLAENFASGQDLQAGDVVSAGAEDGTVVRSTVPNDPLLLGVISTKPAVLLNVGDAADRSGPQFPVALSGRVPCKVVDEGGPIRKGDLLTSSSTSGHAMKAQPVAVDGHAIHRTGTIIGKALQAFDGTSGTIEIFVLSQ